MKIRLWDKIKSKIRSAASTFASRFAELMPDVIPLGLDWRREVKALIWLWISCVLISFCYFIDLSQHINSLYGWDRINGQQVKVLRGTMMPDFYEVLDGNMDALFIGAVLALLLAVYHYTYHYQGSRSIYLMRRLPKKYELLKRCLTVPVAASVVLLLTALLLVPVYYGLYMAFVPQECIVPGQWGRFIASVFGG